MGPLSYMRYVFYRNVVMRRISVLAAVAVAWPLLGSPRNGHAAHCAFTAFVLVSLCRFLTWGEHAWWRVCSASPPTSLPAHPSGNTSPVILSLFCSSSVSCSRHCLSMHTLEITMWVNRESSIFVTSQHSFSSSNDFLYVPPLPCPAADTASRVVSFLVCCRLEVRCR